ncbi:hypothetical protein RRG08_057176 [Elysia crispata]|uniref:IgGFc-binding protein N-terminal domain-containing protein n=1 Tax=Elysia crispata TaxID=231223 RepID=A0AAE1CNX1_9GAST|nr:hypothetical protein RRG08_057176 [Elysia crispata]
MIEKLTNITSISEGDRARGISKAPATPVISPGMIMKQMLPTHSWGETYLIPHYPGVASSVRVVALEAATIVEANTTISPDSGTRDFRLNKALTHPGDHISYTRNDLDIVRSNQSVLVVVTYVSSWNGDSASGFSQVEPLSFTPSTFSAVFTQYVDHVVTVAIHESCDFGEIDPPLAGTYGEDYSERKKTTHFQRLLPSPPPRPLMFGPSTAWDEL